jgi:hypothetical protein
LRIPVFAWVRAFTITVYGFARGNSLPLRV